MMYRVCEDKGTPVRILLIEDIETDVKILLRALEKAEFSSHVYVVQNGQEALNFILHRPPYEDEAQYPRPGIILLDNQMPKMDGQAFIRELKSYEHFYAIPIIVHTSKEGQEKAYELEGVDDYIVKSLDATNLIARMKSLL